MLTLYVDKADHCYTVGDFYPDFDSCTFPNTKTSYLITCICPYFTTCIISLPFVFSQESIGFPLPTLHVTNSSPIDTIVMTRVDTLTPTTISAADVVAFGI